MFCSQVMLFICVCVLQNSFHDNSHKIDCFSSVYALAAKSKKKFNWVFS